MLSNLSIDAVTDILWGNVPLAMAFVATVKVRVCLPLGGAAAAAAVAARKQASLSACLWRQLFDRPSARSLLCPALFREQVAMALSMIMSFPITIWPSKRCGEAPADGERHQSLWHVLHAARSTLSSY